MRYICRAGALGAVLLVAGIAVVPGAAFAQIPQDAFLGSYFNDANLGEPVFTRTDARIDFDWGENSPDPRIEPDTFSVRWEGMWQFSAAGTYRFTATTDDGMRLFLDDALVLDRWFDQSATTHTAERSLPQGSHRITVEYYENGIDAVARVSWAILNTPPPTPSPSSSPTPSPTPSSSPTPSPSPTSIPSPTPSPQSGAPYVQTLAATGISQTFALLEGSVNPDGAQTSYWFEYDTSLSLGRSTERQSAGFGTSTLRISTGISDLDSNTRYYFRIAAENEYGAARGSVLAFTTAAPAGSAPRAETRAATGVGLTSATVRAEINPMGAATSFRFEYGETASLGSATSFESAGSGTSPLNVSASLSNVSENTTYYFRAYAENQHGSSRGQILSFTTEAGAHGNAPTAQTSSATSVGQTFATLRGSVNPNGVPTSYRFEYGVSQSLGGSTETLEAGSGTGSVSVSIGVSDLEENRTHYFRIVAENQYGTTRGSLLSFTTLSGGGEQTPTAETRPATNVGQTFATFQGQLNPQGSQATYWFEYGTSPSFGTSAGFQSAGAGTSWLTVSSGISNLNQNTTYYFRLVAQSSRGTSYGATLSFTTTGSLYGTAPSVQTTAAENIGQTFAAFRGHVNPKGAVATAWFEYGVNQSSLSFATNYISAGSGNAYLSVSQPVSNLTSRTVYYARLAARNEFGTSYGQMTSFTTLGAGSSAGFAPLAVTRDAAAVTQNFAFLKGEVNPQGGMTTAWFEFGPTTALGLRTSAQAIPAGAAFVSFGTGLPGLLPNTAYHFRAAAQNQFGTSYGTLLNFRTSQAVVIASPSASPVPPPPPAGGGGPVPAVSGSLSCLVFLPNMSAFELQPGQEFTFTVTYRNECRFALGDASLDIEFPFATMFLSSDAQMASVNDGDINYSLGSVPHNSQSSVSVKGMVKDDAAEGTNVVFGAILTFTDDDNRSRAVRAYVAGIVRGGGGRATATVFEQFKNLVGNWLFWVVVVFLIFLAFLMRRRGRRTAKKEELELAREPRSQPA